MSYEPQAGTVPARVAAYFREQPKGHEIATRPLAAAIGVADKHATQMQNYLATGVAHGLFARRKAPGEHWTLWSMGDGKAKPKPKDAPREPPRTDEPIKVNGAGWKLPFHGPVIEAGPTATELISSWADLGVDATKVQQFAADSPICETKPASGETTRPVCETPLQLRFALWSDGRLEIKREDSDPPGAPAPVPMLLTAKETKALVHYLERMAVQG